MHASEQFLADLTYYRTYPQTKPNGRKETWSEIVHRNMAFHLVRHPEHAGTIKAAYQHVFAKRVLPSMRSLQFAGEALRRSNARLYNCVYTPVDSFKTLADIAWLGMNGCGVGYSVQGRHVCKLPPIRSGALEAYVVPDTKEGWATALLRLLYNPATAFDYSSIRPKGSPLSTGGVAAGPEPLRAAVDEIRGWLFLAEGRRLRPLEVHDIICRFSQAIEVGGVRRVALISLFDPWDLEMFHCKDPGELDRAPWRQQANNSILQHEQDSDQSFIMRALDNAVRQRRGEPGVVFTRDYRYGYNPCVEAALRERTFCNLVEINVPACRDKAEFLLACGAASVIATLQAGCTDFEFINPEFTENTREDALIGVSLTGLAEAWEFASQPGLLSTGALRVREVNARMAEDLGINPAKRCTLVKPSGTASLVLGCSSGIHSVYDRYYLRRVTVDAGSPLARVLVDRYGLGAAESGSVVEESARDGSAFIVTLPVFKDVKGAIYRQEESALQLLERAKFVRDTWILNGHGEGPNFNNVSLTVEVKDEELGAVSEWMLNQQHPLSGVSFFPASGGGKTYPQMPFESVPKEVAEAWLDKVGEPPVLSTADWTGVQDKREGEKACAGGLCDVSL